MAHIAKLEGLVEELVQVLTSTSLKVSRSVAWDRQVCLLTGG